MQKKRRPLFGLAFAIAALLMRMRLVYLRLPGPAELSKNASQPDRVEPARPAGKTAWPLKASQGGAAKSISGFVKHPFPDKSALTHFWPTGPKRQVAISLITRRVRR